MGILCHLLEIQDGERKCKAGNKQKMRQKIHL